MCGGQVVKAELKSDPGVEILEGTAGPAVKEHPFLEEFNAHQYRILTDCAMQTHFRPGETLFREGDPADSFYLIQQGKVALEARTKDHGLALIQTLGEGEVLGWSWLFPPYFWHFSASALEDTDALHLRASILRDECEADHDLGFALIKRIASVMLQRLQATRKQMLELREKGSVL